ncbi:hypothetical protein J7E73_10185 [Paenibacillus albidus]|uniref:hypothetical protein n=1 Tax=Paenibacillus albidus TaxID=2041023 RepID=UPI001BE89AFA|nr:hypothetical protein [Paenibacillus albidus]MBT2289493.1 hypothetical protein [Paenibacillus albidus]
MNAKNLSNLFKKASEILALYDDSPIEDVLDDIYNIVRNDKKSKPRKRNNNDLDIVITNDLIQEMTRLNSEELAKFLKESEIFQSKKALVQLAKELSITTSDRNNSNTLSHSIIKFFERQKLDKFIREDRNLETPNDENKV